MIPALRHHWPEYLMEAAGLGIFMLSAAAFAVLLESPGSPAHRAIPSALARRGLMGLAMGLTAVAIVYSPLGRRSGAHINPAVTLTFLRLGKLSPADALWYALFQVAGGVAGLLLATALLGDALASPSVRFVATLPGPWGRGAAFAAECCISFLLMTAVLRVSNDPARSRYTGLCAGALVALYIAFEAPLSGMSMNPARSLASALPSGAWTGFWIYVLAPPLAMLAAAEVHLLARGRTTVRCAKLHHDGRYPCIFRCGYGRG